MSRSTGLRRWWLGALGRSTLFLAASTSLIIVLFIFYFITRDAIPFFTECGVTDFLLGRNWYPSGDPAEFGAYPIFFGTAIVTLGATLVAVPLGIVAAICLSDLLSFRVRQLVKPIVEMLAAIPSVAYGFFALVVLAPLLQNNGGQLLSWCVWLIGVPPLLLVGMVVCDLAVEPVPDRLRLLCQLALGTLWLAGGGYLFNMMAAKFAGLQISSGANALNVSLILGIMALPTVVSVSEDALQAVGRDLREGSYALGATRAETLLKVILPAASSGICAACILGIMRAVGETMVVWMASGNASRVPVPFYDVLQPIRTLTATIAGDMGEADQVTGSARYHVLFAMAFCLLSFSLMLNMVSEWIVGRARKKGGK
jgi:phosphate transport system permease protein